MSGARVAILWHEADRDRDRSRYLVSRLIPFWREWGLDVVEAFGPARSEPADLALLHVDLSVVDASYLELAATYPRTLNGSVADIRKSRFSRLEVGPQDAWDGPVIVKTQLNCGGQPERRRGVGPRRALRLPGRHSMRSAEDYLVLDRLADVPRRVFRDPTLIVERFVPERDGAAYAVRIHLFLGTASSTFRLVGSAPIVGATTLAAMEPVPPHPEIDAHRRALGFDYGKFDYVEHDGELHLLDVNKTPGSPHAPSDTPERVARLRARAKGLFGFLE